MNLVWKKESVNKTPKGDEKEKPANISSISPKENDEEGKEEKD